MGEPSKSGPGSAAKALQNHLDQDRSSFRPGPQHRNIDPAGFRHTHDYAGRQQLADAQFAQEQMARMHLDDFDHHSGRLGAQLPSQQQSALYVPPHYRGAHGPSSVHNPPSIVGPAGPAGLAGQQAHQEPQSFVDEYANYLRQHNGGNVHSADHTMQQAALSYAANTRHSAQLNYAAGPHHMPAPSGLSGPLGVGGFGFAPPPPQFGYHPNFAASMHGTDAGSLSVADSSERALSPASSQLTINGDVPGFKEAQGAWEASFEEAMNEWMFTQGQKDAREAYNEDLVRQGLSPIQWEDEKPSEPEVKVPESLPESEKPKEHITRDLNSSELARAAQQLVDAVADNDSEKFRNSTFVDLMRRIAKKEVVVEDNTLVEVDEKKGTGVSPGTESVKGKETAKPIVKPGAPKSAFVEDTRDEADDERDD